MNSITENAINSYAYNNANNTDLTIQSTKDNTSNLNATTQNTINTSDTIEISNNTNSYTAFSNTLDEVSSETELFPCDGANGYMSAQVAFFVNAKNMELAGYDVPSFDNSRSNYSKFIDKMKDFLSSNSNNISYSSQLIDFCDTLKERLNMYGIS